MKVRLNLFNIMLIVCIPSLLVLFTIYFEQTTLNKELSPSKKKSEFSKASVDNLIDIIGKAQNILYLDDPFDDYLSHTVNDMVKEVMVEACYQLNIRSTDFTLKEAEKNKARLFNDELCKN